MISKNILFGFLIFFLGFFFLSLMALICCWVTFLTLAFPTFMTCSKELYARGLVIFSTLTATWNHGAQKSLLFPVLLTYISMYLSLNTWEILRINTSENINHLQNFLPSLIWFYSSSIFLNITLLSRKLLARKKHVANNIIVHSRKILKDLSTLQ